MLDEKTVDNFMCLTPRVELLIEGKPVYRNISDYQSEIEFRETEEELLIKCKSRLVSGKHQIPEAGATIVFVDYKINESSITIAIRINEKPVEGKLSYIFPLVCSSLDQISLSKNSLNLKNSNGSLVLESNYALLTPIPVDKRVYNFIPGLQAYPIEIDCSNLQKKELLLRLSG